MTTKISYTQIDDNTGLHQNVTYGLDAGDALTTPDLSGHNTAIGYEALKVATTPRDNTAVGYRALNAYVTDTVASPTIGIGGNTAIGANSMPVANDVYQCTAVGDGSLLNLTSGLWNTAIGWGALAQITTHKQNTAVGLLALGQDTEHNDGTAVGFFAGASAKWTEAATLIGLNSGLNLGSGGTGVGSTNGGASGVTLVGNECGSAVLKGDNVTALGSGALRTVAVNKTGDNNTVIGAAAGQTTLITASNCTLLGKGSDVKADTDGQTVITDGEGRIRLYDDGSGNTHLTASSQRGGAYNIGGFGESFLFVTATASFVIPVAIPSNARILGCQIRVDQALAGGDTWDAAYSTGATQAIATNQAVALDTKVNAHFDTNAATDITSGVTDITITKNGGGSFTAQGLMRAFVYYQTFTDLDNT